MNKQFTFTTYSHQQHETINIDTLDLLDFLTPGPDPTLLDPWEDTDQGREAEAIMNLNAFLDESRQTLEFFGLHRNLFSIWFSADLDFDTAISVITHYIEFRDKDLFANQFMTDLFCGEQLQAYAQLDHDKEDTQVHLTALRTIRAYVAGATQKQI